VTTEQQNPEPSQEHRLPPINWDETYRQHAWDYLAGIGETPRYSAVAGYVLKLVRRGHVLDAGCGEGLLLEYLNIDRIRYTGFDISPTAIHRACQRYRSANLFSCSLDDFAPPAGDRYDIIIFNEVLTSLERSTEILNRFYTFLQPSGHIIISQFQHPDPNSNACIFTQKLEGEIAAGRYPVVAKSEVLNCQTGLRWKVYCLGDSRRVGELWSGTGDS
jgi:2-polyprenyl-3-methyl-5-hydroxy-6-metoxy-1,4-benzoquinol methylase